MYYFFKLFADKLMLGNFIKLKLKLNTHPITQIQQKVLFFFQTIPEETLFHFKPS